MSEGETPLARRLRRLIAAHGPISLAEYMQACLADPEHGYYARRETIGIEGDFITAPEISQIFGELIGIWCVETWRRLGRPSPFALVEAGPGRGTLMRDCLRAAAIDRGFCDAARVVLVETSSAMREHQTGMLEHAITTGVTVSWTANLDNLPVMPVILLANEFLDALPFRQYVKRGPLWHEAGIGTGSQEGGDRFERQLLAANADPSILPSGAADEPDGAVFEHAPAREAAIRQMASYLIAHGGAALIIDYGHTISGFGDTFQAVAGHRHADPFERPGEQDLTSHVDFARLGEAARAEGIANCRFATQGEFLLAMGLLERAGALGADMDAEGRNAISEAVERLAGPKAMGTLFKVMGFSHPPLDLPGLGGGTG